MASTLLFDSHAHYDDSKFDDCRFELLDSLFSGNVGFIVNAATDIKTARGITELCRRYNGMYCAVGIYPHECGKITDEEATLNELQQLLQFEKAVAVGEIGLDYHYDDTPRDIQKKWLDLQFNVARETGKPVVVHDREAHMDCFEVCRANRDVTGVFHSYSGSAEMARQLTDMGWYISFSGSVTFKGASKLLEAVAVVPPDRILIETDAPYLAPVPLRGTLNNSNNMIYTAQVIASARGISTDEVIGITAGNAKRLFSIKG